MNQSAWQSGVYAITDANLLPDDATLLDACEQALRGGLALLQYRDKSADADKRYRQARALATLCQEHHVPLIVNDDSALAFRLRHEGHTGVGLHLGQQDGGLAEARERLGPAAIIGATCHGRLDLAERARQGGASYLAFGRFFRSRTKPDAPPAALSLLGEAARFGLPRVAIGGIDRTTLGEARRAGADLLACVHGVFGGDDIESRVKALNRILAEESPPQAGTHGLSTP
ncbi:thiamine phosphate synthase [Litchfieldella xinjiangensis]|uniref:thiamine phosphate synthase n=1 Tax=Litchfieldella xinjiangensis TaxID=1166948 RepID=UPI0006949AC0|nr:thiamine phosphate synthase [Halomonas xinjiangensis]